MSRVVRDQREKFATNELFRKLSKDFQVRYERFKDRQLSDRAAALLEDCEKKQLEIAFVGCGLTLTLLFKQVIQGKPQGRLNNFVAVVSQENKVYMVNPFIFNGVCVIFRGWLDTETLEGRGHLEFDGESAKEEEKKLLQQPTGSDLAGRHYERGFHAEGLPFLEPELTNPAVVPVFPLAFPVLPLAFPEEIARSPRLWGVGFGRRQQDDPMTRDASQAGAVCGQEISRLEKGRLKEELAVPQQLHQREEEEEEVIDLSKNSKTHPPNSDIYETLSSFGKMCRASDPSSAATAAAAAATPATVFSTFSGPQSAPRRDSTKYLNPKKKLLKAYSEEPHSTNTSSDTARQPQVPPQPQQSRLPPSTATTTKSPTTTIATTTTSATTTMTTTSKASSKRNG